MKYVLVTGGVVSGLGKGVTASSIGLLLKSCGLRVTSIKIDPYLNTDAGTMSPFEHGEVFVLDDGGEVDLDLGNYERFLDITLTRENNITTGKIYQSVIDKERKGDYLGKTVQVVPHITDEIQEWIERAAMIPVDGKEGPADVCVIELGGTIGDIESMPFIEALGQFSYRVGTGNFCLVHVSLVPVLSVVGEQKTKPTQHSVRGLRGLGLTPNILACRSTKALDDNVKEKLSQFCHVPAENIVTLYDVPNIWHIPLLLRDQKAHEAILKGLNLLGIAREPDLTEWTARTKNYDMLHDPVKIAMVGKYVGLTDSYLSVLKALLHASVHHRKKLVVEWVEASHLEDITAEEDPNTFKAAWNHLKGADGILVPGGFGDRGVQGKILAAKYARESNVPFLGICLGMQIAVIEYARSVLGLHNANSIEFDPKTSNPCVIFMPEGSKTHMGGTMRLGTRRTYLKVPDCKSAKLYGDATFVDERHRHRYEVNPDMISELEAAGMSFVGRDESGRRMEIVELPSHPFFIGVQFHPEFKSRPGKPSALFSGLIAASCGGLTKMHQSAILAPALQSQWLMMHVSMMVLGYAALLCGSLLSVALLVITFRKAIKIIGENNNFAFSFGKIQYMNERSNVLLNTYFLSSKNYYRYQLTQQLDRWSYRIISLGFIFLTIGILSGAVWANEAWGSYWNWDPKETWAFITWTVFAIYFHTRTNTNLEGVNSALVASMGFLIIWICYFGVNLLGIGLHSYGSFTLN